MSPDFPAIRDLVPHADPMVFLERVVHHDRDLTVCATEAGTCRLLHDGEGQLAAWMGIELMAQCIAVHAGLVGRESGGPVRVGLLIGARRVGIHTPRFHRHQSLLVKARHLWGRETGPVSFECSVEDETTGRVLVDGRLNCFVPSDDPMGGGG